MEAASGPSSIYRKYTKYTRKESDYISQLKIYLYGSYIGGEYHKSGKGFLEEVKNNLIEKFGHKQVFLVEDMEKELDKKYNLSDKAYELSLRNMDLYKKVLNFLRSIYSLDDGDAFVFIFTAEPTAIHLHGALVELTYYCTLKIKGEIKKHALALFEESLYEYLFEEQRKKKKRKMDKNEQTRKKSALIITSLLPGMLPICGMEFKSFKDGDSKECAEQISTWVNGISNAYLRKNMSWFNSEHHDSYVRYI